MKIATFLLRRGEVVPFANDAKFIELTKAYDAAYAAKKKQRSKQRLPKMTGVK